MAIVWWEDFESLSTANLAWRLDEVATGAAIVSGVSGMTGQCFRQSNASSYGYGFAFPASYTEGLFSAAMHYDSATFSQRTLLSLNSSAAQNLVIRLNTNGSITAMRDATELATSAAGVIPGNKRFRIEVGFVISATVGEVKVNIDTGSGATTVINLTGQNTNASGGSINRVRFINQSGLYAYLDDMWFDTDKTAFRADHTFTRLAPSADVSGVSTCSTGTARYALIDESPASTTDYLTFSTIGEDLYDVADLSTAPASIAGVGAYYVASKTDAGTLEFRSRVKSNTDYANGTTQGLNMSTLGYSDFFATDPQGGGAWTKSRVDAVRLVLERVS